MLTVNQPQTKQEPSDLHYIDNGSMLNALLAAKDETIAAMQNQLATKDEIIQAKDDVIAGLRQQLKSLRSQIEQTELKTELSGYPFPMGAAETERDYKRK
jgi:septal ring factor EnvC (AmiA/AmiB activator)